jgi:U3 small nucleolar RNA-associated protein 3
MAGKKRRGQKTPNFSTTNPDVNNAKGKKLESYEDTLEPGSTDHRKSPLGLCITSSSYLDIFQRDQIMFNPQDESDGDDDFTQDGEEVLSLNLKKNRDEDIEEDYEDVEEEEEEDEEMPTLSKKEKAKAKAKNDLLTKGRFGKPIVSSDEEDEASGSGSGSGSSDEEEGWGRSYYSRPSSRKEKEDLRRLSDYRGKRERDWQMMIGVWLMMSRSPSRMSPATFIA